MRGGSLRRRLVVTAVSVVGATLAVGAIALVSILRASLERGVTNTALVRAADVASLARAGTLPASLAFPGEERSIIQVVAPDGTVVASTGNIAGETILAASATGPYTVSGLPVGDQQRFRMTVTRVDTGQGLFTIVSGESLERVDATMRTVRVALGAGLPAVLLLVGGLAWSGTRRALQPVEAIRAEVAAITDSDLHRRVPEPGGDDEIANLAQTMNAMLDRLEAASARQARFVSDASHELRSPLTLLRALLEIGLARPQRSDWPARAEGALVEVARLEGLVADLLVLGRAVGGGRSTWVRFDLTELVTGEVARWPSASGVEVVVTALTRSWVDGDPGQVSRAVGNLLANAMRHATSHVSVTSYSDEDKAVIEVADDGPGVPDAEKDRIFERFVRLDEARATDDGGSGLGLAIVRSIVETHDGTVAVVSGPPGATFRIVLPAASPPTIPAPDLAAGTYQTETPP